MTRKTQSYREQGRAVFLAAIMVLSVVAVSAAFAGPAAAQAQSQIQVTDGPTPDTVAPGESFDVEYTITNTGDQDASAAGIQFSAPAGVDAPNSEFFTSGLPAGDSETVTVTFDVGSSVADGDYTATADATVGSDTASDDVDFTVSSGPSPSPSPSPSGLYTPANPWQGQDVTVSTNGIVDGEDYDLRSVEFDSGEYQSSSFVREVTADGNSVEIETDDLEAGDYIVTGPGLADEPPEQDSFEVRIQDLTAEFDSDSVTDEGDDSVTDFEFDSNRNSYDVVVHADGDLDDEELTNIFDQGSQFTIDAPNSDESDDLDDDYDLDPSDAIVLRGVTDADDYELDFEDIDTAEYDFQFDVSDTTAGTSDSITVGARDIDAEFSSGVYDAGEGDISEMSFEVENTDEVWVQVGSANSEFLDVLYIEVDDEDEPINITINNRLLGGHYSSSNEAVDKDFVYDTDNVETLESGVHGGFSGAAAPSNDLLFGDDGEFGSTDFASSSLNLNQQFSQYLSELELVEDASDHNSDDEIQLKRPPQDASYDLQIAGEDINDDEAVFDADAGDGEATDTLDNAVLEFAPASISGVQSWTAPGDDADETETAGEVLEVVTQRDEIAAGDRAVIQFEATGLYGSIVAGADGPNSINPDWDRLEDGVSTEVVADAFAQDGISLSVEAEEQIGNQEALQVDLTSDDTDSYVVIGPDYQQMFLIVDTSEDSAFANGDAPTSDVSFTAELEYDEEDFDYEDADESLFQGTGASSNGDDYPYIDGSELIGSHTFDIAPAEIEFNNLNDEGVLEAEAIESSAVSGETNVAPGTDAELRVATPQGSDETFRMGESISISDDGSISTEFDFSENSAGTEFDTRFLADGNTIDRVDSVLIEEQVEEEPEPETYSVTVNVEDADGNALSDASVEIDGQSGSAGDSFDLEDGSYTASASAEGFQDGSADVTVDGSSTSVTVTLETAEEETPGFGAIVALVALIGAALLAVRRQN